MNPLKLFTSSIVLVTLSQADIHTDLTHLNTQVLAHQTTLEQFSFLEGNDCSDLSAINRELKNTVTLIESITYNLSTVSLNVADMESLNSLSNTTKAMANESYRIGS